MSKRKREQSSQQQYNGVTENGNHYHTSIWIAGIQHYRGTFHSPIEAARAYDHAAIQAGYPTSELNFPEEAPPPPPPASNKALQQQSPLPYFSSSSTHAAPTPYTVGLSAGYRGVYKSDEKFEAQISNTKDHVFFSSYPLKPKRAP